MVATSSLTDALVAEAASAPHAVNLLIQSAKLALYWPDLYTATARLLSLALTFDPGRRIRPSRPLAFRRLRNAEVYARTESFGAAAIELRLLAAQLDPEGRAVKASQGQTCIYRA